MLAPGWWDFTTQEDFYLAEALEYIDTWKQATADEPSGICGPIGPTVQLPLVARLVNEFKLDLSNGHFWGIYEWYQDGKELAPSHPLSFEKPDRDYDREKDN
jgi:glucosamine-6-phosphate deaminase